MPGGSDGSGSAFPVPEGETNRPESRRGRAGGGGGLQARGERSKGMRGSRAGEPAGATRSRGVKI